MQEKGMKPMAWTAFQPPLVRQLENIIHMFCIVLQNKKSDVYPSRAFSFCFNKGCLAIIGIGQRTAPHVFSVITAFKNVNYFELQKKIECPHDACWESDRKMLSTDIDFVLANLIVERNWSNFREKDIDRFHCHATKK